METQTPAPVPVRDRVLGFLGDDPLIRVSVESFLRDAAGGTLTASALVPRWADYLRAWAGRFRADEPGIKTVRVGQTLPETQGETLVSVRIEGEKHWSGWVALVRSDAGWLVSDIQVVEREPASRPFDPEAQGQEISSPSRR